MLEPGAMSWAAAASAFRKAPSLAAKAVGGKLGLRPSSCFPAFESSGQQALACPSDHRSCGEAGIMTLSLEETE